MRKRSILMTGVIYKIESPTGRTYIGQTIRFHKRIIHYRNHHCAKQYRLLSSFVKHGFDNHKMSIIETVDASLLNERERYWQDHYEVTGPKGLNITLTGHNGNSGSLSESTKRKLSQGRLGKNNPMFGKKTSEKTKELQRKYLSGEFNYLSKLVLNTETGIFYNCLREAAESCGLIKGTLWAKITRNKKNNSNFVYA